jgi:hypothetical protein
MQALMKATQSKQTNPLGRWLRRLLDLFAARVKTMLQARRAPRPWWRPPARRADERTIRRLAERERGGLSSRESAARYERGENPGGLHHKAVRREGPEHPRHHLEEPKERKEKMPGGVRHIPVMRRGS